MALFAAFGAYAAHEGAHAVGRARLPPGKAIDLAPPLSGGTFLVANGGSDLRVNAHLDALDEADPSHRPWWGTAHGIDLVQVDRAGLPARGLMPSDPAAYLVFGTPVTAPCAGQVVVAVDGRPDMPVPTYDPESLVGNHVILRCPEADIVMAHFRHGSLRVRQGAVVDVGDEIAAGEPLPIRLAGRFLVRNDRVVLP